MSEHQDPPAATIDEVIAQLDGVIDRARRDGSRAAPPPSQASAASA